MDIIKPQEKEISGIRNITRFHFTSRNVVLHWYVNKCTRYNDIRNKTNYSITLNKDTENKVF